MERGSSRYSTIDRPAEPGNAVTTMLSCCLLYAPRAPVSRFCVNSQPDFSSSPARRLPLGRVEVTGTQLQLASVNKQL